MGMTVEPISDEALALLREEHSEQVAASLPGGNLCAVDDYYVPCPTLALLARLDAAEARAEAASLNLDTACDTIERLDRERKAALARAVPDGHTRIDGKVYRVRRLAPADLALYRLVPADTEEKP